MSIFTALSGAVSQGQKLDTVSNNIANVNTPAFKKDRQIFREQLIQPPPSSKQVIELPSVSSQAKNFNPLSGQDKKMVAIQGTYTDFKQGNLRETNRPLDFALEGRGFFEVLTPTGIKFTRSGNFKIDPSGRLVTSRGFPILGERRAVRGLTDPGGARSVDPNLRVLRISGQNVLGGNNINVSYDGRIYSGRTPLGKISLVDLEDLRMLKKEGHSLYFLPSGNENLLRQANQARVHQGFIEGSNVNLVEEMTDMIQTTRTFESHKQLIKAFDSMSDKLVNQVPRTR